jgi:carboxymethylenebutenolidase
MIAGADGEVSPERCEEFANKAHIPKVVYAGADHNFDDPGKTKQAKVANRKATADAMHRAEAFFAENLGK